LLKKNSTNYEACVAITSGIVKRQKKGDPVHTWTFATDEEAGEWVNRYWKVEQIMSTDLFTVHEDDLIYFVANVMNWNHLHYLPVEDNRGELVGLITSRALLDHYSTNMKTDDQFATAKEIMIRNPVTVSPETLSLDALNLMRKSKIGCLPVLDDKILVGLVTEMNFMNFSEQAIQLLVKDSEARLRSEEAEGRE
jgi:CBS domain-containing protein